MECGRVETSCFFFLFLISVLTLRQRKSAPDSICSRLEFMTTKKMKLRAVVAHSQRVACDVRSTDKLYPETRLCHIFLIKNTRASLARAKPHHERLKIITLEPGNNCAQHMASRCVECVCDVRSSYKFHTRSDCVLSAPYVIAACVSRARCLENENSTFILKQNASFETEKWA